MYPNEKIIDNPYPSQETFRSSLKSVYPSSNFPFELATKKKEKRKKKSDTIKVNNFHKFYHNVTEFYN